MFCNNCGKDMGAGKKFCPSCGAAVGNSVPNSAKSVFPQVNSNSVNWKMISIALVAVCMILAVLTFAKDMSGGQSRIANSDISDSSSEQALQEKQSPEELLVGVWSNENYEITLTKDGSMRIGTNDMAVGGGILTYEVVDENTLYLSGTALPVGINTAFTVSKKALTLELMDETINLTRK